MLLGASWHPFAGPGDGPGTGPVLQLPWDALVKRPALAGQRDKLAWLPWGGLPGIFSRKLETSFSGLKCVCQLCEHTNFTCQTEGACWASVMLANGREEVVKSCVSLPELNAQVFCHSSKNITKTECCYTDFCNNITLHLPVGKCRPRAERCSDAQKCCAEAANGDLKGGCKAAGLQLVSERKI